MHKIEKTEKDAGHTERTVDSRQFYFCAKCRKILSNSRSQHCHHCACIINTRKKKEKAILAGRICLKCGNALASKNTAGFCHRHNPNKDKGRTSYVPSQNKRIFTGQTGSCHMPGCKRSFKLEAWQHSKIHFCPHCRRSEEYKTYSPFNGWREI